MTNDTTSTTASGLPVEFADLEPFADWILDNQPARYAKRLASTIGEMQAFYDIGKPRLDDIMAFCDGFPIEALPEPAKKLMYLTFSLVEASFPVECWRQPRVPDSGSAEIVLIAEPAL